MKFDPSQTHFETFAQWHLWHLGVNLSTQDDPEPDKPDQVLHAFFHRLYQDMYTHPSKYSIPLESYPDIKKFNQKRLKVNRIVKKELDFLYQLAKSGRPAADAVQVDRPVYAEISAALSKNINLDSFLEALQGLGLEIQVGELVNLTTPTLPGLPSGLHRLAQACSSDRIYGLFHFQRCDLRLLRPNFALQLDDLLRVLPAALAAGVRETDAAITEKNFRRKIGPYGDFGYRITYTSKAGVIAYIHVHSYENEPVYMVMRWVLDAQQSRALFERADTISPEFASFLFEHVSRCDPQCLPGFGASSPEQCVARISIEKDGQVAYACKDARYNQPGALSRDFGYIQKVARLFREIIY